MSCSEEECRLYRHTVSNSAIFFKRLSSWPTSKCALLVMKCSSTLLRKPEAPLSRIPSVPFACSHSGSHPPGRGPLRPAVLELKTRLETKLRKNWSHGSEAQASFPQQLFAGLRPLPGNLTQSRHGLEKNPWSETSTQPKCPEALLLFRTCSQMGKRWGAIFLEPRLQLLSIHSVPPF